MSEEIPCSHSNVVCLNEFELVRKYRCRDCSGVMMCQCDAEIGRDLVPHQLRDGVELESQKRIAVNLGFVANVCRECRRLPLEPHPVAAIYGRTSKIKRY